MSILKACENCKFNEKPCMFITKFRSVRSKTQEKAHAILCSNCKCVDTITGKCKRISNQCCGNYAQIEEDASKED